MMVQMRLWVDGVVAGSFHSYEAVVWELRKAATTSRNYCVLETFAT